MNAQQIQQKLRTVEALHSVEMLPVSAVATPYFNLRGYVLFHGEKFVFESQIDIREFQSDQDVARLGASLLAAVSTANDRHIPRS